MRALTLIALLGAWVAGYAQNKPLLYNVDDLPQTLMSNPGAEIDFRGHAGIPFLSQLHLSGGTSGINLYDVFNDANPDINAKIGAAIERLSPRDHFAVNEQLEILSFGLKLNAEDYLSLGIYQELDTFLYFPKDIAVLANEGNRDYINHPFDFSQLSFTGELLTVYHLGLNRIVNSRLSIGARGKLYSGVLNAESTRNNGTFTTVETPQGPNVFRHYIDDVDIVLNASGVNAVAEEDVPGATRELLKRSFFGGSIGAGVDLGFAYKVNEQLTVTGALQDVGVMYHYKDVENYLFYGDYQTDGFEPVFTGIPDGEDSAYWDAFANEIEESFGSETLQNSYLTWRPVKINTSVEFGFGRSYKPCNYLAGNNEVRFLNLVGMHISAVKRPKSLVYGLTTYYDRKIAENFRFKLAYTLDDYSYTNFGAMFSATFNVFNVYLAVENLFDYNNLAKANHASMQFGMQLILDEL